MTEKHGEKATLMTGFNMDIAESITKTGTDLTDNTYTITNQDNITQDFDIILKVGVASLTFRGELERDPDIEFEGVVSVEMVDAAQKVLYSKTYDFISGDFSLSKWNKQDGDPLRARLDKFYQDISKNIIEDLFIQDERSSVGYLPE